jgi:rSAM/selenodomain-associated transferase 1
MAKYPTAGRVKTRLGEVIGHEEVTYLYLCFLKDTIENVKRLGVPFFIYYTPDDKKEDFEQLFGNNLTYVPQIESDLGRRIYQGFKISFAMGHASSIALGSDIPDLPETILAEALQRLKEFDSVIGPSFDGGYYLMGLRKNALNKKLFQGINWSTKTVLAETMNKINDEEISCYPLAPWWDVDNIIDLKRLMYSRNPVFNNSHTWNYLKRLSNQLEYLLTNSVG